MNKLDMLINKKDNTNLFLLYYNRRSKMDKTIAEIKRIIIKINSYAEIAESNQKTIKNMVKIYNTMLDVVMREDRLTDDAVHSLEMFISNNIEPL